jgi:uncharacterized protein
MGSYSLPVAAVLDRATLARRAAELVAIFILLPLLVRAGFLPVPRLVVLAAVAGGAVMVLHRDAEFKVASLWAGPLVGNWPGLLARTGVAGLVIAALVLWLDPTRFLALPRERPGLWLAGLVLYPFLSAWPQEVLYRAFFFRRYAVLFGSPGALVIASGVAFGLLHVIYPNLVAPLLSVPAGLILAWRYARGGTLGPVWLEHAPYGLLLFSLGLGNFFYDGRS